MSDRISVKLAKSQLDEFSAFLGSPPVLSSESEGHYNAIWEKLIERFAPQDLMELFFVRQVQNETWKVLRYTRHQTLALERRVRQSLEFQARRKKDRITRREELVKEFAEKAARPVSDFSRLLELERAFDSSVIEVDDILERTPTELEHNKALEACILLEERLDRLINSALRRRNEAIEQLEFYGEGLGRNWRQVSDKIIDAEATEVNKLKQIKQPLIPTNGSFTSPTSNEQSLRSTHRVASVGPTVAENGGNAEQTGS
jgi:hypothetical protein